MAYLGNYQNTKAILDKYGFTMQKKFGQNFLVDASVLENIVTSAGVTKEDCVLEIGPGIGTMTQYLCEHARFVIAVEIDKKLIPVLNDTLSEYDNKVIINQDILKLDLNAIAGEYNDGKPLKIVANLPYYITTPIIMGLFESRVPLESITAMVQLEVAERMQEGPGSKEYGALSLAVQYYSKPRIVLKVGAGSFIPRPTVDSAVIRMDLYKENPVSVRNEAFMFALIRASFNQRRKTLVNSLSNAGINGVTKETVSKALEDMGLSQTIRGEALSLSEFARLSDIICS